MRRPPLSWALLSAAALLLASCAAHKPQPSPADNPNTPFTLTAHVVTPADLEAAQTDLEQHPKDPLIQRNVGVTSQILSPPDHWDLLESAIQNLEAARQQLGDDPQTLIYLGLAKAARGMDPNLNPFKRLASANQGFALMDTAVQAHPNNLSLRLLRAKAALLAPPLLGQTQKLEADHNLLRQQVDREGLDPHLRLRILIFLGDVQDRREHDRDAARRFWQQAVDLAGNDPWGQMAQSRLDGAPAPF